MFTPRTTAVVGSVPATISSWARFTAGSPLPELIATGPAARPGRGAERASVRDPAAQDATGSAAAAVTRNERRSMGGVLMPTGYHGDRAARDDVALAAASGVARSCREVEVFPDFACDLELDDDLDPGVEDDD